MPAIGNALGTPFSRRRNFVLGGGTLPPGYDNNYADALQWLEKGYELPPQAADRLTPLRMSRPTYGDVNVAEFPIGATLSMVDGNPFGYITDIDNFTMRALVKPAPVGVGTPNHCIMGRYNTTDNNREWYWYHDTNNVTKLWLTLFLQRSSTVNYRQILYMRTTT